MGREKFKKVKVPMVKELGGEWGGGRGGGKDDEYTYIEYSTYVGKGEKIT